MNTFIDIHVHGRLFDGPSWPGTERSFRTLEQLVETLRPQGVSKAVYLPCSNPEGTHVLQGSEEALEAARRYPDFIIPFMNVDPRMLFCRPDEDLRHLMSWYKEHGCRGVGEVCCNLPWDDPLVENLFACAQDLELPVDFHMARQAQGDYGLRDTLGMPGLEGALRRFPRLKLLAHSQAFWCHISGEVTEQDLGGYPQGPVAPGGAVVRLLREYENLYGDLSAGSGHNALARDPEFGYRFLTEFQDRLLFGTDVCLVGDDTPLFGFLNGALEQGHITREVFDKIAYRNAEKLLDVSVT